MAYDFLALFLWFFIGAGVTHLFHETIRFWLAIQPPNSDEGIFDFEKIMDDYFKRPEDEFYKNKLAYVWVGDKKVVFKLIDTSKLSQR